MKRYRSIAFSVDVNSIFWKCNLGHFEIKHLIWHYNYLQPTAEDFFELTFLASVLIRIKGHVVYYE